jgi:hypothetical protein
MRRVGSAARQIKSAMIAQTAVAPGRPRTGVVKPRMSYRYLIRRLFHIFCRHESLRCRSKEVTPEVK